MSHAFWEWSLDRYEADGVAAEALRLQDDYGLNVNICLWCVWLAEEGRNASPLVEKAAEALSPWSKGVTEAIREARRQAKSHPRAQALYKSILACELDAEHIEQDILFELAADAPVSTESGIDTARSALVRYAQTFDSSADFESFLKTVFQTVKKV